MSSVPPGEVAPFIKKLRTIVDAGVSVSWSDDGTTFMVSDVTGFERDVLSKYFKSPHMASFVRQLNFYGFRKMTSRNRRDQAGSKTWEFQHANFLREDEAAAVDIRRRSAADTEAVRSEGEMMRLSVASLRNQLAATRKDLAKARAGLEACERARAMEQATRIAREQELAALRRQLGGGASWAPSAFDEGPGSSRAPPALMEEQARNGRKRMRVSTAASPAAAAFGPLPSLRATSSDYDDDDAFSEGTAMVAGTPSAPRHPGADTDGAPFASRLSPSVHLAGALSSLRLEAKPTLSAMGPPMADTTPLPAQEPVGFAADASFQQRRLPEDSTPDFAVQADAFADADALASSGRAEPPGLMRGLSSGTADSSTLGLGTLGQESFSLGLSSARTEEPAAQPGPFGTLSRVDSVGSLSSSTSSGAASGRLAGEPARLTRMPSGDTIDSVDPFGFSGLEAAPGFGPDAAPALSARLPSSAAAPSAPAAPSSSSSSSSSAAQPSAARPAPSRSSAAQLPDSAAALVTSVLPQLCYQASLNQSLAATVASAVIAATSGVRLGSDDQAQQSILSATKAAVLDIIHTRSGKATTA